MDDTGSAWSGEEFVGSSLGLSCDESESGISDLLGGKGDLSVSSVNDGLGLVVKDELFISIVLSLSETNLSSSVNVDNLTVEGSDFKEALGFPSPVGGGWSSLLFTLLSVGSGVGVSDSPSLGNVSVHFIQTDLDVVGLDVSTGWLSDLTVYPEEGSVKLDFSTASSSVR